MTCAAPTDASSGDNIQLSAIAHKLISPRSRNILFVFIFFYLMLLAGAFIGILSAILSARPDVPLGIIPLGTANDFARQVGIPPDPDHAMDVILQRKPRRFDTASLNGRRFLNVSTGGVGATPIPAHKIHKA